MKFCVWGAGEHVQGEFPRVYAPECFPIRTPGRSAAISWPLRHLGLWEVAGGLRGGASLVASVLSRPRLSGTEVWGTGALLVLLPLPSRRRRWQRRVRGFLEVASSRRHVGTGGRGGGAPREEVGGACEKSHGGVGEPWEGSRALGVQPSLGL